ncbi:hypothetical protein SADUNF_Sadunf18G0049100 [Salix dunnii]|uniref:Plastid lipid-associated protein/fibrillin conserved domain-containing protein n=1 Tax=Salix dunnii TaxID=1413687 RepID=A0A835J2Q3_9ROSI|nr:hypothetical protein SADUNF_Sadunf18G0049100 [Salix dunnii]
MRKMPITHSRSVPPIVHPWTMRKTIADGVRPIHITKVAEQSPGLVNDNKDIKENVKDSREVEQIKADLYQAVQVINRGIFGVPSVKQSEIHGLAELLESQNPTSDPTLNPEKVGGCWKLVYSTITILGSKRTKLGLRDFITLGDFFQNIDVAKRVDINYESSTITPDQKRNIKRELQEESLSNRYQLEDYNPQQEMGSKKDLYSEVLSLDNASEINNELEKDEKSNDYDMDSYNPALEGLNGQDTYSSNNESLQNRNPIVVERSERALLVTQELIYNNDNLILFFFNLKKKHLFTYS